MIGEQNIPLSMKLGYVSEDRRKNNQVMKYVRYGG